MILWLAIVFLVFVVLTVPIGFAMGGASVAALLATGKLPLMLVPQRMLTGVDSFPLLAIPLFMLAGSLMDTGGISLRLVNLAKALVGHIRGGLGMVVVVGEIFFSGISGSTAADVSAIGSLLIPTMNKAGYRPPTTVAIVSAASAMGILVPPCILMVVLGTMVNLSIGTLFISGFLPAFVLAAALLILVYYQALREGLPSEGRHSLSALIKAVREAILPMLFPAIIFGGILGGIFTATEAAAVAVAYALAIGVFVYREITWSKFFEALVETAISTALVVFLVGTASIFAWILGSEQVPQLLGTALLAISPSPVFFLLLSDLIFVIFGSFLEGMPALIILVPIMFPIAASFGVDPLHYSILVVAAIGIGLFLPPMGLGVYIATRIADVDIREAARALLPYLAVLFLALLVITYIPWFTLVVPRLLKL